MEALNWKHEDWGGREYSLYEQQVSPVGKLAFDGWSNYDATYTAAGTTITFKNKGWVEQRITIAYNNEEVATTTTSVFGKTELQLVTGQKYSLKSEAFSFNRWVHDEQGNLQISFTQTGFSFRKGDIAVNPELPALTREVLLSTSLYLKALAEHQAAILVIVFIPIFLKNIL